MDIGAPYGESLGALHGALNRAGEELLRDEEGIDLDAPGTLPVKAPVSAGVGTTAE